MKKKLFSILLALTCLFTICSTVAVAFDNRASLTLSSYNVVSKEGDNPGEIKIVYDVRANSSADSLGISSLTIYRSDGTKVTTITGTTSNGLLGTDSMVHRSTYVYSGTSGASYYASATVYAEIGENSDSRRVTTKIVTAP
ncbi:MAG: hypothetical protein HFF07_07750 [Oscillospiraceae bacterium]|nr:hypothetical protein [Oscillospiraceae bacterium]